MSKTIPINDRTLVITRIFNAPPRLVFTAWSAPEHLVRWFGPNGFTLPTCEQDFREGGRYRFCMKAPDGSDHWVWGEYREISEYDRLVFTWDREDQQGGPWVNTVITLTFEEAGGRTKFTMHQAFFATKADRDEHEGGWSEAYGRLEGYLREHWAMATTGLLALVSAPARRALERIGATTIEQLEKHREADILALHGMGPNGVARLRAALEEAGKTFREP